MLKGLRGGRAGGGSIGGEAARGARLTGREACLSGNGREQQQPIVIDISVTLLLEAFTESSGCEAVLFVGEEG